MTIARRLQVLEAAQAERQAAAEAAFHAELRAWLQAHWSEAERDALVLCLCQLTRDTGSAEAKARYAVALEHTPAPTPAEMALVHAAWLRVPPEFIRRMWDQHDGTGEAHAQSHAREAARQNGGTA